MTSFCCVFSPIVAYATHYNGSGISDMNVKDGWGNDNRTLRYEKQAPGLN